jgi:hypothetical protein
MGAVVPAQPGRDQPGKLPKPPSEELAQHGPVSGNSDIDASRGQKFFISSFSREELLVSPLGIRKISIQIAWKRLD